MSISVRTAVESDWASICRVDGRAFGFFYTPELIDSTRAIHDVSRFELALDGEEIVAIVAAFTLHVTLPGGGQLPMGGLTWVSTAATHRRQGLLTRLMARTLDDIDRRGEPVAMLFGQRGRDLRAVRVRGGIAGAGHIDRSPARATPPGVPTRARKRSVRRG